MSDLKKAIRLTIVLTIICGLAYPLVVTGIGQVLFTKQANGSLVEYNGEVVGSKLIGQTFNDDKHFVGRLSNVGYNISEDGKEMDATSGSANTSPSSPDLKERVEADVKEFLERNPTLSKEDVSNELISQSGSGLDPHITPRGAEIQIPRIAKETGLAEEDLKELVEKKTDGRWLGLYGEERVNVLELNIAIEEAIK
ncbi:potassium-transporting ATPase subunit KdpC [Clostridium sp. LP20]|uniref:potassium-transporting ATPase subunit KdpC n=1 Tax=Clostridium sp. LP20 TaxID=3418665 RepID=UPI003EE55A7A